MDQHDSTSHHTVKKASPAKSIAMVIAAIAIAGVGFFSGMQYQKKQAPAASAGADEQFRQMQGGGFGGGAGGPQMNGSMGTVSAISTSSITVSDQRSGSAKTYSITSSTTITGNGSSATASDIHTGDTVLVRAGGSSDSEAAEIMLNPSFRGGPQANTESSSSSTVAPDSVMIN